MKSVFEQAIETYGIGSQFNQATEELAELIVAINKYRRQMNEARQAAVIEECADSIIMIEQLLHMMGTSLQSQKFLDVYQTKIEKLKKRLKQHDFR